MPPPTARPAGENASPPGIDPGTGAGDWAPDLPTGDAVFAGTAGHIHPLLNELDSIV